MPAPLYSSLDGPRGRSHISKPYDQRLWHEGLPPQTPRSSARAQTPSTETHTSTGIHDDYTPLYVFYVGPQRFDIHNPSTSLPIPRPRLRDICNIIEVMDEGINSGDFLVTVEGADYVAEFVVTKLEPWEYDPHEDGMPTFGEYKALQSAEAQHYAELKTRRQAPRGCQEVQARQPRPY
jgi:hypothetical protein